ncbi:MAG: CaiB/BaiF CoA transferase family protein [Dehalococcoidia bacterium]
MALPLSDIRLLDLSQALAGPFATRMLGDLGAEVIKIEQPGVGDASRRFGTYYVNGENAYYLGFNRNKKGITLDLRKSEARQVFYDLVRLSDVVFDTFRPGVLERLGADYETLKGVNPCIISCSLTGFGQEGPWRDRPAWDSIVQALGGAMSVTGEPGGPPLLMGYPLGDVGGGYAAVVGILTALLARERTGQGQRVDLSMLDVQVSLQAHLGQFYLVSGKVPGPIGSSHPANVPLGAYRTSDGRYLQVACTTQKFYEKLALALARHVEGLEGLPEDSRFATLEDRVAHRRELDELLEQAFATRMAREWEDLLLAADVPVALVQNLQEALESPSVQQRHMVVELEHPTAGRYWSAGTPIKVGREEVFQPAPTLGQHNWEVLVELLGYPPQRVQALTEARAI